MADFRYSNTEKNLECHADDHLEAVFRDAGMVEVGETTNVVKTQAFEYIVNAEC